MEAVPVTGILPWDRGMRQKEMRIFRFDLGQPVGSQNTTLANSETLWDKLGSLGDRFLHRFLRSFPPFPHARVCTAERERELARGASLETEFL